MAALAPIIYNNETIQARYAPSLNAAFKELRAASGITPIVTAPDGGARTAAEQQALASVAQWWLSDHYEDNSQGYAAIDLYNQRAFRNWDEARFIQIMANRGWLNIDISGNPFPSEPWHFANHGRYALAGGSATLIDESTGDDNMMIFWACNADSADGRFKKGQRYAQATPVSPVMPWGDPSMGTAISQQYPGFDRPETAIKGKDLSRLASIYNVSGAPVTVVGVSEARAREIAADEDSKLRIGK